MVLTYKDYQDISAYISLGMVYNIGQNKRYLKQLQVKIEQRIIENERREAANRQREEAAVQRAAQEATRRALEEQARQVEQERLANLYRQAGNNFGNLRNTSRRFVNTSLYLIATFNFGDDNYIFEQKTTSRNAFDQWVLNKQETGTFRVNGNTVIFLSSKGEYSFGTIVGTALQIGNDIYR